MVYPPRIKYVSAIKNPKLAFTKIDISTKTTRDLDSTLVNGKHVANPNNNLDPILFSGAYAIVFKYETFSPKKFWAIRCFHADISNVSNHYKRVKNNLENIKNDPCSKYFIDFDFLDEGIRIEGSIYPIMKMEWADGKNLKMFIKDNLDNKSRLEDLAESWKKLSHDLHIKGIAHGDLQHGNVLVSNSLDIKLVDYDSLYFKGDGNTIKDDIAGIPGYQHPLRALVKNRCLEIDYFSQLVIYTSIRALAEDKKLWDIYKLNDVEHLLFSSTDFQNPEQAAIFASISTLSSEIQQLSNKIKEICKIEDIQEFSKIPHLKQIVGAISDSYPKGIDVTQLLISKKNQDLLPHQEQPIVPSPSQSFTSPSSKLSSTTPTVVKPTQKSGWALWVVVVIVFLIAALVEAVLL